MRRSRPLLAGGALALALALVLFAARGDVVPPPRLPAPAREPLAVPEAAADRPVDVARLRDVFRYADEPARAPELPEPDPEPREARLEPPAPAGPRLVGVVRRGGRLLAALAADGEVELAGPGDSAAGATVLLVEEDAVRVRLADGAETTLQPAE